MTILDLYRALSDIVEYYNYTWADKVRIKDVDGNLYEIDGIHIEFGDYISILLGGEVDVHSHSPRR